MLGIGKLLARIQADGNKGLLRDRVKAWWEGYELVEQGPQRSAMDLGLDHDVRYKRAEEFWETARLRLVQEVWGEGFSSPGGVDHILNMSKYFGLDPALSVLDLGAGLGGAARIMCERFGVWVTVLEADKDLVEAAMALSVKAGMGKKVSIQHFDPESFEFKAKSVDCVFSKEFLFSVKNKKEFLESIEILLKGKGQLLFTDYGYSERHVHSPDVDNWIENEPTGAHPWSIEDYQEVFADLHLEIRVTEDITESFQRMVTQDWAGYISEARKAGIDHETAPALVDEVEIWTRRMQAIDSGGIKVCRMHVIKKDMDTLMSDW